MKPLSRSLVLFFALALSGCAAAFNPGPAPTRLQLHPALPGRIAQTPAHDQITVGRPSAGPDLDTDQIRLVFGRREIRYLADARWTVPAPMLAQRACIDALTASGAFSGVSDETVGLASGIKLVIDLRDFGLHYAKEGAVPTAEFEANFQLLRLNDGMVLASTSLRTSAQAASGSPDALAAACEDALSQALAKLAPWAAENAASKKKR